MVKELSYKIIITSSAERAYFEAIEYIFEHHSLTSANKIAQELLEFPIILENFPLLGTIEPKLLNRAENYRFLLFERTQRAQVKIIYYIDEDTKTVYLTDFFPCEKFERKIKKRS